jgi:hypothetical protein
MSTIRPARRGGVAAVASVALAALIVPLAAACTVPAGPGQTGCAGSVVCDGFEDQQGTVPSGRWAVAPNSCGATFAATVAVDPTQGHDSARSVRVDGGGGYCAQSFLTPVADVAGMGPQRYLRFYVRHATPLPQGHVTFLALHDAADGKDFRLGAQKGVLAFNREVTDATLPELSPAGVAASVALPTDRWACVQLAVDGDAGRLRTWVDGAEVPGLGIDGVPTHDGDGQWLSRPWKPQLTDLRLGWQSYGNETDTVWYDDVALSTVPVGC